MLNIRRVELVFEIKGSRESYEAFSTSPIYRDILVMLEQRLHMYFQQFCSDPADDPTQLIQLQAAAGETALLKSYIIALISKGKGESDNGSDSSSS